MIIREARKIKGTILFLLKNRIVPMFFFFVFFSSLCFAQVTQLLWEVKKSEHFNIYYRGVSVQYVDEVIKKSEACYRDITQELGFTRYSDFWTWDKRAKIYIFSNKDEYVKITNQPVWSAAGTNIFTREIYGYMGMDNFFDIILPHELGHIIFREFVGNKKRLPVWLDEGISSYLEKDYRQDRLVVAKVLIKTASFMQIPELGRMKRGGIFMPDIFYAEAASIIEFLLRTYGKDKFVEFCRKLRDLRSDQKWEVALKQVYKFDSVEDLNKAWMQFLYSLTFTD